MHDWLVAGCWLVAYLALNEVQNRLHLRRLGRLRTERDAKIIASNVSLSKSLDENRASIDRFCVALDSRDAQAWIAELAVAQKKIDARGMN